MDKASILIVEDNFIVMMEIRDRLTELGYNVVDTASSGEEAVRKAEKYLPDLTLMDIRLKGGMDGIEAAFKIKEKFNVPVIYLTAHTDDDTLQRAKLTEPYGYIIKPFEERELRSIIEMALYKHQIERRLRESEHWLSATLKSIGDAIIATDAKGFIKLINPVAMEITALNQTDVIGKNIQDFIILQEKDGTVIENPVTAALSKKTIIAGSDKLLSSPNGGKIPVDFSSAPIRGENNIIAGVVLVFRDVTERKRYLEEVQKTKSSLEQKAAELAELNKKLNESEKELRNLNASKDKFFSIIAHDLRSPFTALLGLSEHLVSEIDSISRDDLKSISHNILKSAQLTFNLLENLLQWARIKTGKIRYEPANYLLNNVIEEMTDLYKNNIESKLLQVEIKVADELTVFADLNMLRLILRNLLSNSIKFTGSRGTIKINAKREGELVKIKISDNGVGIPPDKMEKIFQIDQNISTAGTNNEEGTGLGLILCKEFIEINNGEISVNSPPGGGSEFIFTLPAGIKG